jgi:aminoglycoside phosphotransferase (APT) family kinase protein
VKPADDEPPRHDWPAESERFRAEQDAIKAEYETWRAQTGLDSLLAFYEDRDRRNHAVPVDNRYARAILGRFNPSREQGGEA